MQAILHRGEDARLMLTVEGVGTGSRRLRVGWGRFLAPERESTCRAHGQPGQTSSCYAEQTTSRDWRLLFLLRFDRCRTCFSLGGLITKVWSRCHMVGFLTQTTAAASLDNGSDSALTALESSLTSALVSLS